MFGLDSSEGSRNYPTRMLLMDMNKLAHPLIALKRSDPKKPECPSKLRSYALGQYQCIKRKLPVTVSKELTGLRGTEQVT